MGELETNGAEGAGGRTKGLAGVGRAGDGFPVVDLWAAVVGKGGQVTFSIIV